MTEEKIQQADVHLAAPGSLSALRAATVGAPLCGWKPIETAPKDQQILLGRVADLDEDGQPREGVVAQGCWIEGYPDEPDQMGHDDCWTDSNYSVFSYPRSFGAEKYRGAGYQPTHWMPLPGAPTGQSRTSEAGEATCASNEPDEQNQAEFELHCGGDYEASALGPRERAWAEIQHYAAQYAQDGPVEIYEVKRTLVASQPTGERE